MILLDTCALLWLASGDGNLSGSVLQKIDDASVVFISAITGFEVGMKCRSGKLTLPVPPAEWLAGIMKHHDISEIPVDMKTSIKASELPFIHKDPCDRFIIATALMNSLPVVTADNRFGEYGVHIIRTSEK